MIYCHEDGRAHLTILNRLQPRTFTLPLDGNISAFEMQGSLLMLKFRQVPPSSNGEDELLHGSCIGGVWFFEEDERKQAHDLIKQRLETGPATSNSHPKPTSTIKPISILDLLGKAKDKTIPAARSPSHEPPPLLDNLLYANFAARPPKTLQTLSTAVVDYIANHPTILQPLFDRLQAQKHEK